MRAADLMAKSLEKQGVERMFCVPGESYLALLDALHDTDIEVVACRHEGGAGFMAVADAKLTKKPGVLAISRGPGATNASIAIHLAQQDAVPLVVIIGQVAREERGRGSFQEIDYEMMFGGIAKNVVELSHANNLSEVVARAFHDAMSGTPGPVVVSVMEDVLLDEAADLVWPVMHHASPGHDMAQVKEAASLLAKAKRPLIIAGGAMDTEQGRHWLQELALSQVIPVALANRRQEIFDNGLIQYAGHLGFKIPAPHVDLLKRHDLIIALGTRLTDVPTQGYQLPTAPVNHAPIIHVYPDHEPLGRVFQTALPVLADPAAFAEALVAEAGSAPEERISWVEEIAAFVGSVKNFEPRQFDDGLDFGIVVQELAKQAPHDCIICEDAGNFSSWVHRIWPFDGKNLAIGAIGGAMGLAVPAAVAAGLRYPGRMVMAFAGDGGVMMTGNELATALQAQMPVKLVISNNGSYGTIRLHQERDHPYRTVATKLTNPDFVAWASSFGALGLKVGMGDDVAGIVQQFLSHDGPAVLDVHSSLEAINAFTTMERLRGQS